MKNATELFMFMKNHAVLYGSYSSLRTVQFMMRQTKLDNLHLKLLISPLQSANSLVTLRIGFCSLA